MDTSIQTNLFATALLNVLPTLFSSRVQTLFSSLVQTLFSSYVPFQETSPLSLGLLDQGTYAQMYLLHIRCTGLFGLL
jgi:hypothetical protein